MIPVGVHMFKWIFPAVAVAFLGVSVVAMAAPQHDDVRKAVTAGRFRPLADILEMVQKKYSGNVLDVELDRDEAGRHIYEVKLLDANGRRREIHIDAVSGQEVRRSSSGNVSSLPEMLRRVLARYPGLVVDVDLERGRQGREVYQVRVRQDDGLVRGVFVDAASGELLSDMGSMDPGNDMKSLPELLDVVLQRYPGTVLEAELKYDRDTRPVYEVDLRLLNDTLIEVTLDPVTGRVLDEEEIEVR